MKLRTFQWMFPLSLLVLLHASYGWGGLAMVEGIGPIAEVSARREAALTWTYMQAGRWICQRVGMEDSARGSAEAMFAPARARILALPQATMDLVHRETFGLGHRLLKWSHWGGPMLLLLSAVAYARRQRPVVTTRRTR